MTDRGRRSWSARELALLRAEYPHRPTRAIAHALRRSVATVYNKAFALGLHKTAGYLASPDACRLRRGDNVGAARRFGKGHVPWNKGTHWAAGGRSVETRFKPGHFPSNRDPDFYVPGALRVNSDGYIDMRVSFAPGAMGWRALHRILWQDAHGPVPRGYVVCFKNGDALDCELANLELVSRADLARRNSIHNMPPKLKGAITALGALKRAITMRNRREEQDRGSAQPPVRDAGGSARPR